MGITVIQHGYKTVCVRHSCRKRGGGEELPTSSVWADINHGSPSTVVTRLVKRLASCVQAKCGLESKAWIEIFWLFGAASPTQNTTEKYLALSFGHRTVLKSDFELLPSVDIC